MYIYIYIWNQENTFSLLGRSKCSPSSSFRVICAFTLSEGFLRLPHSEFETWLIHKCSKWFVHLSHWKRSDLCLIQSVLSTVQFRVICAFISSRVIWVHFLYTHTNYTCTFLWVHFAGDNHLLSPYICIYIYTYLKSREHILITTQNNAFNLMMICMYISSRTFPWRNEENTFSLLLKTRHAT